MKTISGLFLILFAVLFAVAPRMSAQTANGAAMKAPSDRAQLEAMENRYAKLMVAKDFNGIMAFFVHSPNLVVFDVVPPRQYTGWEAYLKDWQGLFQAYPGAVQDKILELKVFPGGSVGFGYRVDDVTLTKADGTSQHLIVRLTHGYRKIGGKWYIAHEHVSVPVDFDSGKAVFEAPEGNGQ
jgi:ketosteroid isomerase-like protein